MKNQTHTPGITAIQYRRRTGGGAGGKCGNASTLEVYAGDNTVLKMRVDAVVRRCNSHDALVEALKNCRTSGISEDITPGTIGQSAADRLHEINAIIEDALEKSKGE